MTGAAVGSLPAVFMRGGTSKALIFDARDLPADRARRDAIFLAALGSPDPYGRQLDGMGGGATSVSKVCIVAPSVAEGADVDFTFAQVSIREARVDYSGNCGNMSAAIGPFAIEAGMVAASGPQACIRIRNTNTGKHVEAVFPLNEGRPVYAGDLAIPGVAGTGAPVRLDFLDPGGAATGRLLPTGGPVDLIDVEGIGRIEATLVDAANACVFLRASDLGLSGTETPEDIEAQPELLKRLAAAREAGAVAMGLAPDRAAARLSPAIPYVGFVSPPARFITLTGETIAAEATDLTLRIIANGLPHRALPLTVSLCAGVAMQIVGSLPQQATRPGADPERLRLGMPSGVLTVSASVEREAGQGGAWYAARGSFFRTARKLFSGSVYFDCSQQMADV